MWFLGIQTQVFTIMLKMLYKVTIYLCLKYTISPIPLIFIEYNFSILFQVIVPPISSSHVLYTLPQIHSFMFCKYNSYTHINVYVCKFINTACWDNLVFSNDILDLASLSGAAPWRRLILPFTSAIKPVALLWVKPCEILLMHTGVSAGVVNFRSFLCNHMVENFWVALSTTYRRHYLTADPIPLALRIFLPFFQDVPWNLGVRMGFQLDKLELGFPRPAFSATWLIVAFCLLHKSFLCELYVKLHLSVGMRISI